MGRKIYPSIKESWKKSEKIMKIFKGFSQHLRQILGKIQWEPELLEDWM